MELSDTTKELTHEEYTVAWVCVTDAEAFIAELLLDERHVELGKVQNDQNTYFLGKMQGNNVVIAFPPIGTKGVSVISRVVTDMLRTFTNIRIGLLVGLGGGVPRVTGDSRNEIRLGDVVVSVPEGDSGGVIQYDAGQEEAEGFRIVSHLNKPPLILLSAVTALKAEYRRNNKILHSNVKRLLAQCAHCDDAAEFRYPGSDQDKLFKARYAHVGEVGECSRCDASELEERFPRNSESPYVHYGLIASGNRVVRASKFRDAQGSSLKVLCFEMEAAGLMDSFPCLVIRGISDYSDSHKNDIWQPCATVTASAYAKELLRKIRPSELMNTQKVAPEITKQLHEINQRVEATNYLIGQDFQDRKSLEMQRQKDKQHKLGREALDKLMDRIKVSELSQGLMEHHGDLTEEGTCQWIFKVDEFKSWYNVDTEKPIMWVHGPAGTGKSTLCAAVIKDTKETKGENAAIFHFLKGDFEGLQNGLLRNLAYQLLENFRRMNTELPSIDEMQSTKERDNNAVKKLIHALLEKSPLTYIFIDGLDEPEPLEYQRLLDSNLIKVQRRDTESVISFLYDETVKLPDKLRLWVSCRCGNQVAGLLGPLGGDVVNSLCIKLEHTKNDLRRILQKAVLEKVASPEDFLTKIEMFLDTEEDKTFLWASSVASDLEKAEDGDDVKNVLNNVPHSLQKVFTENMEKIIRGYNMRKNSIDSATFSQQKIEPTWRIILSLVVFAWRPLHMSEIIDAIGIFRSAESSNLDRNKKVSRDTILKSCAFFLQFVYYPSKGDDPVTYLTSYNVMMDYFLQRSNLASEKPGEEYVSSAIIQNCCIRYLLQPKYSLPLLKLDCQIFQTHEGEDIASCSFLTYAAKYWSRHSDFYKKIKSVRIEEKGSVIEPDEKTKKLIRLLLDSPNFMTCIQVQSLFVIGQFAQNFDTVTDDLDSAIRGLPSWLEGDEICDRYLQFISEWGELLQYGPSTKFNGELDRCFWGISTGLQGFKSRYTTFIFNVDNEVKKAQNKYWVQRLLPGGDQLLSCLVKNDFRELHFECWDIDGQNHPKRTVNQLIKIWDNEYDVSIMPYSRRRWMIPDLSCSAPPGILDIHSSGDIVKIGPLFLRLSLPLIKESIPVKFKKDKNSEYLEDICICGNFLVASRRRFPMEDPFSESEWSDEESQSGLDDAEEYLSDISEETSIHSGMTSDMSRISGIGDEMDTSPEGAPNKDLEEDSSSDFPEYEEYSLTDSSSNFDGQAPYETDNESDVNSIPSHASFESLNTEDEDEKGDESEAESEVVKLQDYNENPYAIKIMPNKTPIWCYHCRHKILGRSYRCFSCPNKPDMCKDCYDNGRWCRNPAHQLLGMLDTEVMSLHSTQQFELGQELYVYDISPGGGNAKLLFKQHWCYSQLLYDSPPVIHSELPFVAWALTGSRIVFADFEKKYYRTVRLASQSPNGRSICVNLSFSQRGNDRLLRIAKIDAISPMTIPHRARTTTTAHNREKEGSSRRQQRRFCFRLHISILRLSRTSPILSPPKMLGTMSLSIGQPQVRKLIQQLPFTFTWRSSYLYMTISSSRLRVFKIDLEQIAFSGSKSNPGSDSNLKTEQECDEKRREQTTAAETSKLTNENNENVRKGPVFTPMETIFFPRSAQNRSVHFIPPPDIAPTATAAASPSCRLSASESNYLRNKSKETESDTKGRGKKISRVIIGPKYGATPCPGIRVDLTDQDLGGWIDIKDMAEEELKLLQPQQRLEGPFEHFDVDRDCILVRNY